jgi:23S rRNA (uracil1939-C5)-methyltransferase
VPQEEFSAEVIDLAHDGRGLARVDGRVPGVNAGKVVLIAGALPGERVRYRLKRVTRDLDEAEVTGIEQVSPDRVQPGCAHFGVCGGCSLQHLAPAAQVAFKQKQLLDALSRIGQVQPEEIAAPVTGPAWGYRRRARLSAKLVPKKGAVLVGFRERESPLLAAIESCAVLDPRVGQKLQALARLIASLSIARELPQIEVACADHVALVLRVMREPGAADLETLRQFAAAENVDLWLQRGGPDSIRPLDIARALRYSPDGSQAQLEFGPLDFVQINASVSQQMVRQVLDWLAVAPGERVLELFSGLGNFTVPLARAGARVTAVEGEAGLVERGRANLARNGCEARMVRADLFAPDGHAPWLSGMPLLALLDPPRSGAREVLPFVAGARPRRIVYVSCHPGTLARDAGALVREHGYRLRRAGVLDMFPHTAHVESMALFEKP